MSDETIKEANEPKSTLKDVVEFLNEGATPETRVPLNEVKTLTSEDRLDLRHSLDVVRGLA